MKAYQFRLEPAVRWRSTQLRLEQEKVSQIAAHLAALQKEVFGMYSEVRSGSSELPSSGSQAFHSWSAYVERSQRKIRQLEEQMRQGRRALTVQTQKMVEAHRKLRVIENLKRDDRAEWERELGRESEAFAGEMFLARVTREALRDNGRTGA